MPKLFSYVIDHDYGFAPNPAGGFCTLVKCKYGSDKRNIIEIAEVGDWIAGTGGADLSKSVGHGKLLYAFRVDDKIPLADYCLSNCGKRIDADYEDNDDGRFALISKHFFYFGRNAIDISEIPQQYLDHPFEKTGSAYRSDFSKDFIREFAEWLNVTFKIGIHGEPCALRPNQKLPKCPPKIRRKPCAL